MLVGIRSILYSLGPLRIALAVLSIALVALMPPPNTPLQLEGWAAFVTLVVPALAPIVPMVYFLDVLMALVFIRDRSASERRRYWWVMGSDLLFATAVLAAWLPILLALRR
jgi:hypothetical protein